MKTDPRWSITSTIAVNMLDLEVKDKSWVRYQDVVHLVRALEKGGAFVQKVEGHV